MSATAAARVRSAPVRLAVAVGVDRRDVALRADVVLADALRAALVPVGEPGTVVLDSSGRRLDLAAAVGDQLVDGSAVHVLRPAPAPRGRHGRTLDPSTLSRRPYPRAGLLAIAGGVGLALLVVALLGPSGQPPAVPTALATALVVAALVVAGTGRLRGRATTPSVAVAATVAAPLLAAAAGAWAVLPADAVERRLAVTVALVAAATAAGVRSVVALAARVGDDEAVVVLAALVVVAATQVAGLLLGLPGGTAAAVVVGLGPLMLRLAPRYALAVPDEQLVDLSQVSRTADSVRAPRPRALGRVSERLVARTVAGAERRVAAACVAACVATVVLVPVVLAAPEPGSIARPASYALVVLVVLALVLVPRVTRDPLIRWAPRLAAGALLVELALGMPAGWRASAAALAILLLLVVAGVGAALARGWRSVVASRVADVVENLAVVLSLPVAIAAGGLVEILRRAVS
ncbi:hypothetical protein KIN34_08140 [Cellulomonas sp. DKR-3]|uniref:EccD-like transmembrane domain-containing protein n=1 Tax=Cellulomonas fulva TaxID=2835530 RepID=A0ABS5TYN4_9CELL|nr:hypothetical protein [Cellulomonas fulva]MBT0994255.1 hypothetical protein [Cellulomonas fulva]